MRRSIIACGLLLALAGIPSALAATGSNGQPDGQPARTQHSKNAEAQARSVAYWSGEVARAKAATKHWLTVIRGRPPHQAATPKTSSAEAARSLARTWHRRAARAWRIAHHPPQRSAWYCIHHYEGSWTDPNAPYWGGLQMDYNFQSAYGPWLLKHEGTANHWAPLEQIWAGVRAWRVRGFSPWAGTAHACGVY